jgi:hypothetical protein
MAKPHSKQANRIESQVLMAVSSQFNLNDSAREGAPSRDSLVKMSGRCKQVTAARQRARILPVQSI